MSHSEKAAAKGCILVIDDDPLLTKTLQKLLFKHGYHVETAQSGEEGISKAKTGYYHVVLCDIRMPGLDGIMTLRHIQDFQNQAGTGNSGFIVISGYGSEEHYHKARLLGVSDFVRKPFEMPEFLGLIDRTIQPLVEKVPMTRVEELNRKLDLMLAAVHAKKQPDS